MVYLSSKSVEGYHLFMQPLAREGNKAEALRIYEKLRRRLSDDWGPHPALSRRSCTGNLLH